MNINIFLIRLLQFITFALFLFAGLIYAGAFLLLPLDLLFQVMRALHAIGLPVVLSLLAAGGAVGYIGMKLWKMSALCHLVLDIGKQLVAFGREQLKRYDELLAAYQPDSTPSE